MNIDTLKNYELTCQIYHPGTELILTWQNHSICILLINGLIFDKLNKNPIEYLLYFEMKKDQVGNMMFCNVNLGYVLDQNVGKALKLGCNVTDSKDNQNHFWLLKAN